MIIQETTRLNLDLSPLWDRNGWDDAKFKIRYLDMSYEKQQDLANKIRLVSTVKTIKSLDIEKIRSGLETLNPIIFSQGYDWRSQENSQTFSKQEAISLSGYRFKKLCTCLFKLLCHKKQLTKSELRYMASMSHGAWGTTCTFADTLVATAEIEEPISPPVRTEIGMDDLSRIRTNLEPTMQIPREMREMDGIRRASGAIYTGIMYMNNSERVTAEQFIAATTRVNPPTLIIEDDQASIDAYVRNEIERTTLSSNISQETRNYNDDGEDWYTPPEAENN